MTPKGMHTRKESSSSSQFTKATRSSISEKEDALTSVANDVTKSPCVSTSAFTYIHVSQMRINN